MQIVGPCAAQEVDMQIDIHFKLSSERLLVGKHAVICIEDGIVNPNDVL
jgi:hypothetical protein